MSEPLFITKLLDTVGDGTGSHDAVVDGSVTPIDFMVIGRPGVRSHIHSLSVIIQDTGALFAADKYGALDELTNGLEVIYTNDIIELSLTNGTGIKSHACWARFAQPTTENTAGQGDDYLSVHWRFTDSGGTPIILQDNPAWKLIVRVRDDLTGLERHEFVAQGNFTTPSGGSEEITFPAPP